METECGHILKAKDTRSVNHKFMRGRWLELEMDMRLKGLDTHPDKLVCNKEKQNEGEEKDGITEGISESTLNIWYSTFITCGNNGKSSSNHSSHYRKPIPAHDTIQTREMITPLHKSIKNNISQSKSYNDTIRIYKS